MKSVKFAKHICFIFVTFALICGAFYPIAAKFFLVKVNKVAIYSQLAFLLALGCLYSAYIITVGIIIGFPQKVKSRREASILAFWNLGYLFIIFGGILLIIPGAILWPRSTIVYIASASRLTPWDLVATAFLFDGAFLLAIGLMLFLRNRAMCSANSFRRLYHYGRLSILVISCCFAPIACILLINRNYQMAMGAIGAYVVIVSLYYIGFYLSRRCAKAFLKRRGKEKLAKENPRDLCGSV